MSLKIIFVGLVFFSLTSINAQTNFANIPLDTPENVQQAESYVLEAANLILSTPTRLAKKPHLEAQIFILSWMTHCSYTFTLTEPMLNCCKKNDLFGIYLAALAKGQLDFLENNALHAVNLFIQYVNDPKMEIKKSGPIKKLLKANESNNLSAYTNS